MSNRKNCQGVQNLWKTGNLVEKFSVPGSQFPAVSFHLGTANRELETGNWQLPFDNSACPL